MRENRTHGSEGRETGYSTGLPYPYQPIFIRDRSAGIGEAITAREGYAVGALKIDAPKYVSAIQIVFQRVKTDGRLDPSDSYTSKLFGKPSGKPLQTLDGKGKKAVGIYGRRGAIIDALGLVFE